MNVKIILVMVTIEFFHLKIANTRELSLGCLKRQSIIIQKDIWTFLLYHCFQTSIKEYHTTSTTHIKTLVYMRLK